LSRVVPPAAILITGCSSGIGRATATGLARAGYRVYATVRTESDADSLGAEGLSSLTPVLADVAEQDSVSALAGQLERELGGTGLGALVNNAGTAYSGPAEFIPMDDWRRQLEVNLLGHVAVTQALLPLVRSARGRIVNITSIGGIVATPFFAPYNASKYALEAVSDCLRVELAPWGIETIIVEPGSIATEIWEAGTSRAREMRDALGPEARELYGDAIEAAIAAGEETGARGIPAERVTETIEGALRSRRPRARYLVGRDAYGMAGAAKLLPARAYDRVVARMLNLPR
jgi:NAD(P)-dependent dehydrogenase (short-subunit alcohol dehydrogenase family)